MIRGPEAVRHAIGSLLTDDVNGDGVEAAFREHEVDATLTERERSVLELMAEGRSNAGIGHKLFLSPKTVETHVHAIFSKLDLAPAPDDHRRVLAVLAFLDTRAGEPGGRSG